MEYLSYLQRALSTGIKVQVSHDEIYPDIKFLIPDGILYFSVPDRNPLTD